MVHSFGVVVCIKFQELDIQQWNQNNITYNLESAASLCVIGAVCFNIATVISHQLYCSIGFCYVNEPIHPHTMKKTVDISLSWPWSNSCTFLLIFCSSPWAWYDDSKINLALFPCLSVYFPNNTSFLPITKQVQKLGSQLGIHMFVETSAFFTLPASSIFTVEERIWWSNSMAPLTLPRILAGKNPCWSGKLGGRSVVDTPKRASSCSQQSDKLLDLYAPVSVTNLWKIVKFLGKTSIYK